MARMRSHEAFIRKMLIDEVIVNADTTPLEEIFYEMHKIDVYVKQNEKLKIPTGRLVLKYLIILKRRFL